VVTDPVPGGQTADIRDARRLFPATADRAYFNTAAVGLASRRLADTYHAFIDEWAAAGLDYSRGEQAAGEARSAVARLIGADAADIALIPSVSSAAGLVAAQFGPAVPGESIVIGQREYSSNYFPWRQLAGIGWDPADLPAQNQSTIVSVPLGDTEAERLLSALSGQQVICSARDGNLRLAVHFYNHEDDIERLVAALVSAGH